MKTETATPGASTVVALSGIGLVAAPPVTAGIRIGGTAAPDQTTRPITGKGTLDIGASHVSIQVR